MSNLLPPLPPLGEVIIWEIARQDMIRAELHPTIPGKHRFHWGATAPEQIEAVVNHWLHEKNRRTELEPFTRPGNAVNRDTP